MTPLPTELSAIVDAIVRGYQPQRIVLFGSYARGDASPPHSDLDLLVVKSGAESNRFESAKVRRHIRSWIGRYSFTILPISPERLQERIERQDPFIVTLLTEGRELYAEDRRDESERLASIRA